MDNGKTLCFRREEKVKYIEVVSGGHGMTLVVQITSGPDGRMQVLFMISKIKNTTTLFAAFLKISLSLLSYKQKRFYACRLVMPGVAMLMAHAAWLVFRIVENQAYTSKGAYCIGNLVHWYLPLLYVEELRLFI